VTAVRLDPETIEALAARVAELVGLGTVDPLVTAEQLAEHLGVERGFVYRHANRLGAIRLGEGERAPVRFRLAEAEQAWTSRSTSERSLTPERRLSGRRAIGQTSRRLPRKGPR